MRHFCNFSLVTLGIRPRSSRCAERTRQGERRWSRPPKTALERSYSTENSSSANRILRPRRKKTKTESLKQENNIIYVYYCSFHYTALSCVWRVVYFVSPPLNIGRSTNTDYYKLSKMLLIIQHSRIKVGYSHPPQKKKNSERIEPTVPN